MRSLILTGPESSGKSTIAKHLSSELNIPMISEYSRAYLKQKSGLYNYKDLLIMAKDAQSILQEQTQSKLILDTDILTYKVWSEFKFNKTDPWINDNLESDSEKLYLLCYPDLNWTPDPLRENPLDRPLIFSIYESLLIKLKLKYYIICGKNSRLRSALEIATDYFNY